MKKLFLNFNRRGLQNLRLIIPMKFRFDREISIVITLLKLNVNIHVTHAAGKIMSARTDTFFFFSLTDPRRAPCEAALVEPLSINARIFVSWHLRLP